MKFKIEYSPHRYQRQDEIKLAAGAYAIFAFVKLPLNADEQWYRIGSADTKKVAKHIIKEWKKDPTTIIMVDE